MVALYATCLSLVRHMVIRKVTHICHATGLDDEELRTSVIHTTDNGAAAERSHGRVERVRLDVHRQPVHDFLRLGYQHDGWDTGIHTYLDRTRSTEKVAEIARLVLCAVRECPSISLVS